MSFLIPDVIRNPLRLAGARAGLHKYDSLSSNEEKNSQYRYDMKETLMSVVRLMGAYGFHLLSKKALGEVTFAAVKDNKLITAGLFVGETLLSAPTMLIHVGGVAIRNNLPELFKAWTEKNVSSHAVGLGCLAIGIILLTSAVRDLQQEKLYRTIKNENCTFTYDQGYVDRFLSVKAYVFAFAKHPPKK